MKSITNLFFLFSIILFSCAVQSIPTGGPPDKIGPYIKEISPKNGTMNIQKSQNIEINFNEMIDPKKIKSSIKIYPESEFSISSFANKIIIKPKENWPEGIIKINVSREISDYNGNLMNNSYILNYSTGSSMPTGKISGKLFNNGLDNISEIGLYNIEDDMMRLVCITQSDHENKFKFNNILNGKYVIAALQGEIKNISDDIRKNNYSLYSETILINDNIKNNININFNEPAHKKMPLFFMKENQYFGFIQMNDGSNIYILDARLYNDQYISNPSIIYYENKDNLDSINIKIDLNNNIENYSINKIINIKEHKDDIKKPSIEKSSFVNDKLILTFSEPIIINDNKDIFHEIEQDSIMTSLDFKVEDPMKISFDGASLTSNMIFINNMAIKDLNENTLIDSSVSINIASLNAPKKKGSKGGNIFGKIIYNGANKIIVEAINIKNGDKKNIKADKLGNYKLFDLQPGIYQLWAYEDLNKINDSYFNGLLEPLKLSAKFSYYNELIETRARWDIEQIDIIIN